MAMEIDMKLCFWQRKSAPAGEWNATMDIAGVLRDRLNEASRLREGIRCAIDAAGDDRNRASVKRMLAILEGALQNE